MNLAYKSLDRQLIILLYFSIYVPHLLYPYHIYVRYIFLDCDIQRDFVFVVLTFCDSSLRVPRHNWNWMDFMKLFLFIWFYTSIHHWALFLFFWNIMWKEYCRLGTWLLLCRLYLPNSFFFLLLFIFITKQRLRQKISIMSLFFFCAKSRKQHKWKEQIYVKSFREPTSSCSFLFSFCSLHEIWLHSSIQVMEGRGREWETNFSENFLFE